MSRRIPKSKKKEENEDHSPLTDRDGRPPVSVTPDAHRQEGNIQQNEGDRDGRPPVSGANSTCTDTENQDEAPIEHQDEATNSVEEAQHVRNTPHINEENRKIEEIHQILDTFHRTSYSLPANEEPKKQK
ncbi:hypothetical protein JTB14_000287 [Gonioctena quinquepunctata]|nr:hypothetical protein JTB14_000287 [Gonioctena quinquepunctata]